MLNTAVCATRLSGYNPKGGQADMAANTAVLTAALTQAPRVKLPAGQVVLDRLMPTGTFWLEGEGPERTILKLGDGVNKSLLHCSALTRPVLRNLTIDMNPANNELSGSHDAVRFLNCIKPIVDNVRVIGARGIWTDAFGVTMKVGAGVSASGGYGLFLNEFEAEDCFDGYALTAHPYCRDKGSWLRYNRRCGAVVGFGSDHYRYESPTVEGNCAEELGGAGILIILSNNPKGTSPICNGQIYGPGLQHNIVLNGEVDGLTANDNANAAGCDWHQSTGVMRGGLLLRNYRGVEDDTLSQLTASDVIAGQSIDIDWSIFRSKAELARCQGDVRGWSMDPTGTSYSEFFIDGGHALNVINLLPGENKRIRLAHTDAAIIDPSGAVVSATDVPHHLFRLDSKRISFDTTRARFDQAA